MAPKSEADLLNELSEAVRSSGDREKTKASDLRGFLKSLIKELTAQPPTSIDIKVEDTATIRMTNESSTIKADLLFSSTPEINLKLGTAVNDGVQGELSASVRNSLPEYIGNAKDGRFLFYSAGKTYAFVSAGEAVKYAKANIKSGVFVFRSDVTEPLELLHNCTYDITGFDSVVSSTQYNNQHNFWANQTDGGVRAILKIRRIIRNGDASGFAIKLHGTGTEVRIEGDIIVGSLNVRTSGINVINGAKLQYRGNVEITQYAEFAIYQYGVSSVTDFVGNIVSNTIAVDPSRTIYFEGGILNFTGRIDVLGNGLIGYYGSSSNEINLVNINLMHLNLLGATSRNGGLFVSSNLGSSRLYVKGIIDMRESNLIAGSFTCGLNIENLAKIDVQLENVIILTKPGIKPVYAKPGSGVNKILVIGKFYTAEDPNLSGVTFEKVTPFSIP